MKPSKTDRVVVARLIKHGLNKRLEGVKYIITKEGIEYLKNNSSYIL